MMNNPTDGPTRDIAFSRAVKAGKRIYYVDVKRMRAGEYYLSLTESKRVQTDDELHVVYEKHKVFLYKEDFGRVMEALGDAIAFIEEKQGKASPREETGGDIRLDIEF